MKNKDFDRDLDTEVRDHLERRAADLVRAGMSPDEARRRARIEFGALEACKEQLRDERPWAALRSLPEQVWRDLVMASRRLRATPTFTLFSMATLALGIGVTTAVYSVIHGLALRDVGVRDQDSVVAIRQSAKYFTDFSGPEFADLLARQTSFVDVAAVNRFTSALSVNGGAELVSGEGVSGNYFSMLGVEPVLGRVLHPGDDRPDGPAVAVLAWATWQRRFNADPKVVGQTVRMAGQVFEVAGVAPASFTGVSGHGRASQAVWVPLRFAPGSGGPSIVDLAARDARELQLFARMKSGVGTADAQTALQSIGRFLDAIGPIDRSASGAAPPRHILVEGAFVDPRLPTGLVLITIGIPALVLLVACTNLANLALARGSSRRHDMAVRRTLGASRARLIRELLVEGLLVAVVGSAMACVVANQLLMYSVSMVRQVIDVPPQFSALLFRLDPAVLTATLAFALLAVLVASVAPAFNLTRSGDRGILAADTGIGAAPRWRDRSNMIALQVTVSVCLFLLTAVGVTVASMEMRGASTPAGLLHAAIVNVPFSLQQHDEVAVRRTIDQVVDEVRRIPGVDTVAISSMWTSASTSGAFVTTPDRPFQPALTNAELVRFNVGTPALFRMSGDDIVSGRALDDRDGIAQPATVVVSESLAKTLFRTRDVVGRQISVRVYDWNARSMTTRSLEIVGVKQDRLDNRGRLDRSIDVPFAQHYVGDVSILASGRDLDVLSLSTALRTAVRQADPDVAISFAGRADAAGPYMSRGVFQLLTIAMGGLATLALVFSMAGLYGVLSHVIQRRTREFGLRIALGADRARIARLVLKDAFRPVLEGLFVGLLAATVIRFMLRAAIDAAITGFDPVALLFAAGPLLVAAAVACLVPALRASRVDPNVALRNL